MTSIGIRRSTTVGLIVALLLAAVVLGQRSQIAGAQDFGTKGAGGPAVAHHAGGVRIDAPHTPSARFYDTGYHAGEPTIGLTQKGNVFFAAANINAKPAPNQIDIIRSSNEGKSWDLANPSIGGQKTHPVTLDPYLYIDETEGVDRIFTIDLTVACSILSYSDDEGATWTSNPLACGEPINDHQTVFSGPPVSSPTVGYPNIVYYCFNDIASSSCSKSLDGGITFSPAGTPPYQGANEGGDVCGGLNGHGIVGHDGTVYLPREYCGAPALAISHDEGKTWTQVDVGGKIRHENGPDPSVAEDANGNLYYAWIGPNRLPYVAISTDGGKTWRKPLMIGAPGVKEANLPTIDVGAPGKIAVAYMGSQNSPGKPWNDSVKYAKATWNGYITMSADVLSANPTFYSGAVNDPKDPIYRVRCGPGRCGSVFDFIDVNIGPDGTPWASYVDGCVAACATGGPNSGDEGVVGRLVGGPPLR